MKRNVVKEKSFQFTIRIVNLHKYLKTDKNGFILTKQVLRNGTSIGAVVRESEHVESAADFVHNMSAALKEANETEY